LGARARRSGKKGEREEEEEEEEEITSVQPKGHDEMTLSMRNNHIGKSKQNLTRAKST
jgi:hypothetical protein